MTTSRALAMMISSANRHYPPSANPGRGRMLGRPSRGRAAAQRAPPERAQFVAQVRGDRAHAEDACFTLGVGVVVRVRVDVVRVELAGAIGNEFDAGDADV